MSKVTRVMVFGYSPCSALDCDDLVGLRAVATTKFPLLTSCRHAPAESAVVHYEKEGLSQLLMRRQCRRKEHDFSITFGHAIPCSSPSRRNVE